MHLSCIIYSHYYSTYYHLILIINNNKNRVLVMFNCNENFYIRIHNMDELVNINYTFDKNYTIFII